MRKSIWFSSLLLLTACAGTTKNDIPEYINALEYSKLAGNSFYFAFENETPNIQGAVVIEDRIESRNIMYSGDAGLIGLVAQIGVHSALVGAQRSSLRENQQSVANMSVQSIIDAAQTIRLSELDSFQENSRLLEETPFKQRVLVKPLFRFSPRKDQVELLALFWIPQSVDDGRKIAGQPVYQNVIKLYSSILSPEKISLLEQGDVRYIRELLAALLSKVFTVASECLTGNCSTAVTNQKTFMIQVNGRNTAFRGTLINKTCDSIVFQDLHDSIVVIPNTNEEEACRDQRSKGSYMDPFS